MPLLSAVAPLSRRVPAPTLVVAALLGFAAQNAAAGPTVAALVDNAPGCAPSVQATAAAEVEAFLTSPAFPDDATRAESSAPTNATIEYVASACFTRGTEHAEDAATIPGGPKTRYRILSASASLVAGPEGSTQPANSTSTLSCLFGHTGAVIDGAAAGAWFLDQLATTDEPLAEAYFRAVRRVHPTGTPVVRCYGTDGAAARLRLTTGRRFVEEHPGTGGSAWMTETARRFANDSTTRTGSLPRGLIVSRRELPAPQLARMLLGAGARDDSPIGTSPALTVFRTDASTMTYDPTSGRLAWRQTPRSLALPALSADAVPDVAESVQVARAFLARKELISKGERALTPEWITERRLGDGVTSADRVVARTVVFAQTEGSIAPPLSSAGSVEVTVGPRGEVIAMTASLLETRPVAAVVTVSPGSLSDAAEKATTALHAQIPGATISVIDTRLGYDTGDAAALTTKLQTAPLVVEVLLEAATPTMQRRYALKIPL